MGPASGPLQSGLADAVDAIGARQLLVVCAPALACLRTLRGIRRMPSRRFEGIQSTGPSGLKLSIRDSSS